MSKKVSLQDVASTINGFEDTVRTRLGDSAQAQNALTAINTMRQAMGNIRSSGTSDNDSDDILCCTDQILTCRAAADAK